MENIYSENDLKSEKCNKFGEWKFSLSDEEINSKISSLEKFEPTKEDEIWRSLFSLLHVKTQDQRPKSDLNVSSALIEVDSEMEWSNSHEEEGKLIKKEEKSVNNERSDHISVEEITVCLIDLCNHLAPKLKFGLTSVKEEMKSVSIDLEKLAVESMPSLMKNTWSQLNSDISKLCFCVPFSSSSNLCQILCQNVLLLWLNEISSSKLAQLSEILSAQGEIVCRNLVAPLLQKEDSLLVNDSQNLEELMTSMSDGHWSVLLKEVLSNIQELHKWQIPALVIVVEHSSPTSDDLLLLVQLMSSTKETIFQSGDFGALLVAVASSLKPGFVPAASQLKLVTNRFKGPLKYKVLKILAAIKG